MKNHIIYLVTILMALALGGCEQTPVKEKTMASRKLNPDIWPKIVSEVTPDEAIELKVSHLLSSMALPQKVAQMIQPEIRDITVEDMRRYGFGSYLNGGGAFPNNNKHSTPQDWIDLAEAMYQASVDDSVDGMTIPTMWGTDAVHGHNNVIGATLFPHNIGLGAANNPELIEQIAKATATEVMATGIDWVFAPTVATVRDDRWGRTYEGYSEDPDIVKSYAAAIVHGLQGHAGKNFMADDRVISTVKHFIGDGGTLNGDDQGDTLASEQALYTIHGQGYVGGLTAGAQSVMASFNSWHGKKIHGSKYLLTDVLKNRMGFDGFVVGDWNGHGQIKGCSNENCPQAINAGLDIFMVPTDAWKPLLENTILQVEQGIIPMSRIDDAVTRILRVKYRAGLFDKPSPAKRKFSGKVSLIGHPKHRQIAKQAVRESLVLLKNQQAILPLSPKMNILLTGDTADNIGKQSGGWTITWQGTNNLNSDFPGGSSIYDGFAKQVVAAGGELQLSVDGSFTSKPDIAVVIYGEEPYAEGHGDRVNLVYQRGNKTDLALLKKLKSQGIPVISVFISGRPMWTNAEINASDAFVAAWLPGSEGDAVADVLLKNRHGEIQHDFTGKLSFSWPNDPELNINRLVNDEQALFAYGYGLSYKQRSTVEHLSESYQLSAQAAESIVIFNGQVQKPWQMILLSNTESSKLVSSSQQLPGIQYRTIDNNIQEDAFKLTLDGTAHAGVRFSSVNSFREDLSQQQEQHSALVFMVKPELISQAPVLLSMNCESDSDVKGSCRGQLDITATLAKLPQGEWSEMSVNLNCFAKQGIKFDKIVVPFEIVSRAPLALSISEIEFVPNKAHLATVQCQ